MKKYEIIYTDPPWQYNSGDCLGKKSLLNKDNNFHYPTMPLDDIKAIDVPSLCADDCLMFMWAVSPKLDEAIEVLKHWGFSFNTVAFCWHKQRTNPGYYTMSSIELVIVGKRGKIPTPRGARNVKQFLSQKSGKHSEKPSHIRRGIEEMFPTQNKLEMFARNSTDGWDIWGNELDADVELDVEQHNTFEGMEEFLK